MWFCLYITIWLFVVAFALLIVALMWRHVKAVQRVEFYKSQGMSPLPGYDTFITGNRGTYRNYFAQCTAVKGMSFKCFPCQINTLFFIVGTNKPLRNLYNWSCDQLHPEAGPNNYDPSRDPIVVANILGNIRILVACPDTVQELLVTKNSIYDKTGIMAGPWSKIIGGAFFFNRVDEVWKAKRKACSHAFYKERLVHMIEVFKDKMELSCSKWQREIAEKGHADIDLHQAFQNIFMRNLIHVAFGEDIYDREVEVYVLTDLVGATPMVLKKLAFGTAIDMIIGQILKVGMRAKLGNPFYRIIYGRTGWSPSFTRTERTIDENCIRLRSLVYAYLQETKGNAKAQDSTISLVALFRQTPEVFTDEFIIDELMDFFLAGVTTTTSASKTFISHFASSRDSVLKVREEIERVSRASETYVPIDSEMSKLDFLKKHMTWQNG